MLKSLNMFQFLIGRLKSNIFVIRYFIFRFQFLIGRLKSIEKELTKAAYI
ncbi:MAG: hypothetical protein HPY66_2982 [Firmicutes bacterium]|nr:hypothetical protein [Bacillota bacterium]